MNLFLLGLVVGWAAGFGGCWVYFLLNRLIRTRSEWYADRRQRGLSVPDDWEEDR
jgi:hypothetical protein